MSILTINFLNIDRWIKLLQIGTVKKDLKKKVKIEVKNVNSNLVVV